MSEDVLLGGSRYQRAWFVPRMALALMAEEMQDEWSDEAAWERATKRAAALADKLSAPEEPHA